MKKLLTLFCLSLLSAPFAPFATLAHAGEQPSSLTTAPSPVTLPVASKPTTAAVVELPSITLRVPANTHSREETIYVGDIGPITGADEATLSKLKALSLGRAAAPGQNRTLSVEEIINALRASGLVQNITVIGEKSVHVMAVLETFPADRLGEAACTAARTFFDKIRDVTTEVDISSLPSDLKLRPGEIDLQCDIPDAGLRPGPQMLRVMAFQKNRKVGEGSVGIRIKVTAEVCVAAQRLSSGDLLADDAFKREHRELSPFDYTARCDASRFIGQRLKNGVSAGQILVPSLFAMPFVIRKGEAVSVHVIRGGLELVTRGEARSDAAIDESIQIKISDTDAIVIARASGPRTAHIDDPREPKHSLASASTSK